MSENVKSYSKSEIARHNGENDSFWLIIHDRVYDVSSFLEEHPGGEEVLMSLAGKDSTECFDDIGHSQDAINLRERYFIGTVSEHPGGEEVLIEQAGKDATESFEDVGHSSDARELMAKYKIGELVEEDRVNTEKKKPSWNADSNKSSSNSSSWTSWIFPVVIGVLATVFYRYYLSK